MESGSSNFSPDPPEQPPPTACALQTFLLFILRIEYMHIMFIPCQFKPVVC